MDTQDRAMCLATTFVLAPSVLYVAYKADVHWFVKLSAAITGATVLAAALSSCKSQYQLSGMGH